MSRFSGEEFIEGGDEDGLDEPEKDPQRATLARGEVAPGQAIVLVGMVVCSICGPQSILRCGDVDGTFYCLECLCEISVTLDTGEQGG